MNKEKTLNFISNTGEVLVLIGAAFWITGWESVHYVFAVGTLLFTVGRLLETHPQSTITLRRLYIQRNIGVLLLVLSAFLMLGHELVNGLDIIDYQLHATPSAWLLPFMIFVIIELYTAFRIPSELKKENK